VLVYLKIQLSNKNPIRPLLGPLLSRLHDAIGKLFELRLRRHSQGTIQSNNFTIKHRIQQNSLDQVTVLVWASKSRGEWHRLSQFFLDMVGQVFQQGSFEQTWSLQGYKVDSNGLAPEESGLRIIDQCDSFGRWKESARTHLQWP
jgi:hypothetical protein